LEILSDNVALCEKVARLDEVFPSALRKLLIDVAPVLAMVQGLDSTYACGASIAE